MGRESALLGLPQDLLLFQRSNPVSTTASGRFLLHIPVAPRVETKKDAQRPSLGVFNFYTVEHRRIELLTFCLQSRCSTN